jgi:pSer/pThr/pTyr-binding forkhead associated (FHA) protein
MGANAYCTDCGYALEADFVCCPNCGKMLGGAARPELEARTTPSDAAPAKAAPATAQSDAPRRRNDGSGTVISGGASSTRPAEAQPPARTARTARLVVMSGPDRGASFEINGPASVGRGRSENVIVLDDDTVSRKHGVFDYADQRYVYSDLGSTNGSYVIAASGRRRRVRGDVPLQHGDELELGGVRVVFHEMEN